ncbi:hypothetical protein KR222_000095, partial [Zaprionus bogoriensis]
KKEFYMTSYLPIQCSPKSYRVSFEQIAFRVNPDYDFLDSSNLHLMGRERMINGTIVFKEDIDDNFRLNISFFTDSTGTGDWHSVPFNIKDQTPCAALQEFGPYLEPTLIQDVNTNAPIKGDVCPIPKGAYYFRDILLKTDNWPAQMPRGPGKAILILEKDGLFVGEFEVYVRIEDVL